MSDPFHAGERYVQEHVGVRETALRLARLISGHIPPGAVHFIARQEFCVLGQTSSNGDIWAHGVVESHALAHASEDGSTLHIRYDTSVCTPNIGDQFGILFIDLVSRVRLRVNGTVVSNTPPYMDIRVAEAFPNCPKYIQQRQTMPLPPTRPGKQHSGEKLTRQVQNWITNADTFFVSSAQSGGPADVSHRGGKPGFVHIHNNLLSIPDYPGNSMFGTLGNLAQNPRAGLVFVDFERGQQLLLTGETQLNLDAGDNANSGGTGRWWHFTPRQWTTRPLQRATAWRLIEPSPFNP